MLKSLHMNDSCQSQPTFLHRFQPVRTCIHNFPRMIHAKCLVWEVFYKPIWIPRSGSRIRYCRFGILTMYVIPLPTKFWVLDFKSILFLSTSSTPIHACPDIPNLGPSYCWHNLKGTHAKTTFEFWARTPVRLLPENCCTCTKHGMRHHQVLLRLNTCWLWALSSMFTLGPHSVTPKGRSSVQISGWDTEQLSFGIWHSS